LFNPSIVRHPDQSGLAADSCRFILSLRAVGEGHISSFCDCILRSPVLHSGHCKSALTGHSGNATASNPNPWARRSCEASPSKIGFETLPLPGSKPRCILPGVQIGQNYAVLQ
jgi:hypothetical protein